MVLSFALPRFSGSTLEPSSEPIMLYEPQYYQKGAGRATHIEIVPTRPTPALKRSSKPPHITIPKFSFDAMHVDDEDFSPWSSEDNTSSMLWDPLSTTSYTPL